MYTQEELKDIYGEGYDIKEIGALKEGAATLHACGYSIKELSTRSGLSERTLRDFTWGRHKAQRKTIDLIRELVKNCELRATDLVENFSIWEELTYIEHLKENMTIVAEEGLFKMPCPLCKANYKKSFCLNKEKKTFYCDFCKKSGDVISLVASIHFTTQYEAMRIISHKIARREMGIQ